MKKYTTLIAAILIMVCLGGVYAWSVFVPYLTNEINLSNANEYAMTKSQTGFTFGLIIGVFTLAMVLGGKLERKYGPKPVTALSGIMFFLGYLIAALSKGNPHLIIWGLGIFAGAGTGFGYLVSIAEPIKWFPERKGLITGLSVAGFGGGAILLSSVADKLLTGGMDVLNVFLIIGALYGGVIFLCTFLIFVPGEKEAPREGEHIPLIEIVKDKKNWGLFLAMFSGTFAGLLITGNLKPIASSFGIEAGVGVLSISFLAIGNGPGRILWGFLSDLMGTSRSIVLSLALLGISIFLLPISASANIFFLIVVLLIGLGFGANFVLFASRVSGIYGVKILGAIYPFIFLSYGIAGLTGPAFAGFLFDKTNTYSLSVNIAALISIVGIVFYLLLSSGKKAVKVNTI